MIHSRKRFLAALVFGGLALHSAPVDGQPAISVGVAQTTVLSPGRPERVSPSTVVGDGSGSAVAAVFGFSGRISPKVSLGVEITVPESLEFHAGAGTTGNIDGTFRDISIAGLARVRVAGPLEAVGGIAIIKVDSVQTRTPPSFALVRTPSGPTDVGLGLDFGVVLGADVAAPMGRHLFIVPGVRLQLVQRGEEGLGLGSVAVHLGVAVRAVF